MNQINKEKLLKEIKVKLNLLNNQSPEISLINFNLNIGYLETLIKKKEIDEKITTDLILKLKDLNFNKTELKKL